MPVKLQKEHLEISEVICSKFCQTTVESDVIVPDVKPDIIKILQADSEATISHKHIQGEKVFIQGTVNFSLLYVPDNGIPGSVKAINCTQEFNYPVDIPGADAGMELSVDAECEPAEYTLLNSRKLNVRTRLALCIRLLGVKELDIVKDVDEDSDIELLRCPINLYNPCVDALRDVIVRERLEVPSGKPSVSEILKFSVRAYPAELRITADKLAISGELKVCTLYCGDTDDVAPEVMEHTIPFSELLEIEGLREDMTLEPEYRVKEFYFEICQDSDGDNRILSCEFTIEFALKAFACVPLSILADAYSQSVPVEIKKETYSLEQLVGSATESLALKELVKIPDYLPEMHRLCECNSVPTIESVTAEDRAVNIKGYLTCTFLYLSLDSSQPASGFSHILPFSHTFSIDGVTPDAVCDAKAEARHTSCTISGERDLEVRANLSLAVKVTQTKQAEAISEIVLLEDAPKQPKGSMIVYFVQKGDTLWDIAKRYQISPAAILSANGTESEIIRPGKCIYIFK